MFEKIAFIRSTQTLERESVKSCISGMIGSLIWIPLLTYLMLYVHSDGALPAGLGVWQYAVYAVPLLAHWYVLSNRTWAHSYMMHYTDTALQHRGGLCPRCFAPMTQDLESVSYEEVVGVEEVTTTYSDGWTTTDRKDIKETFEEEVPYLLCSDPRCGIKLKPQPEHSSGYAKVADQLERYHSFFELPMFLGSVYRLIAGDRRHYRSSMLAQFERHMWIPVLSALFVGGSVLFSLRYVWQAIKSLGSLLFGSTELKIAAAVMVGALLVLFSLWELLVLLRCRAIGNRPDFSRRLEREPLRRIELSLARQYTSQTMARMASHMVPPPEKRRERKAYEAQREAYVASVTDALATLLAADGHAGVEHWQGFHLPNGEHCTAYVDEHTACTALIVSIPGTNAAAQQRAQAVAASVSGARLMRSAHGFHALSVIAPSTSYRFEGMDKAFLEKRAQEFLHGTHRLSAAL